MSENIICKKCGAFVDLPRFSLYNPESIKYLNSQIREKKVKLISEFVEDLNELGDVIIFDQRITHRGMVKQVKYPRILISFGFGKNNIFTDNFEKGTIVRQDSQNKI